jgi:hypothetical protein
LVPQAILDEVERERRWSENGASGQQSREGAPRQAQRAHTGGARGEQDTASRGTKGLVSDALAAARKSALGEKAKLSTMHARRLAGVVVLALHYCL